MSLLICVCLYHTAMFVPYSLVVTCWKMANLLALLYVNFFFVSVTFPYGVLDRVWYLIIWIPELCLLFYFEKYLNMRFSFKSIDK